MRSYTSVASARADFTDFSHDAAYQHARCRATGLDPLTYSGLAGVALALGHTPTLIKAPPWEHDHDLVNAILSLRAGLDGRRTLLRGMWPTVASSKAQALELAHAEQTFSGCISGSTRYWINDCVTAQSIITSALSTLRYACVRLSTIPYELGERYAAVYTLVRQGQTLPLDGRWLAGAGG